MLSRLKNPTTLFILLFSVLFLGALFLFLDIAEDILTSSTIVATDLAVAHFVAGLRTPALTGLFLLITEFGSTISLVLIGAAAALSYAVIRKGRYLFPFVLGAYGASENVQLVKSFIARDRPAAELAFYAEKLFSFPSGHAASSVAIFGFIVYVWLRSVTSLPLRILIIAGAIVLILAIGASRIYLGVHYLSDVLGGYLLGSLWLMIAISIAELGSIRKAAP